MTLPVLTEQGSVHTMRRPNALSGRIGRLEGTPPRRATTQTNARAREVA